MKRITLNKLESNMEFFSNWNMELELQSQNNQSIYNAFGGLYIKHPFTEN